MLTSKEKRRIIKKNLAGKPKHKLLKHIQRIRTAFVDGKLLV